MLARLLDVGLRVDRAHVLGQHHRMLHRAPTAGATHGRWCKRAPRVSGPWSGPGPSGWSSGAADGRTGRHESGRIHHAAAPQLQVSRGAVHLSALRLAHPSQPTLQGSHFLLCLAEAEPRPPAPLGLIGRPLWLGRDLHLCVPAASPLLLRGVLSASARIALRTHWHWHAHDCRLAGHRPGALGGCCCDHGRRPRAGW